MSLRLEVWALCSSIFGMWCFRDLALRGLGVEAAGGWKRVL